MTFFKYVAMCFVNVILFGNGMSNIARPNIKNNLIGIGILIILSSIFCFFGLLVFKQKRLRILYAFLVTLGFIFLFFVICLFIEWIKK